MASRAHSGGGLEYSRSGFGRQSSSNENHRSVVDAAVCFQLLAPNEIEEILREQVRQDKLWMQHYMV